MRKGILSAIVLFSVFILVLAVGASILYNLFSLSSSQGAGMRGQEALTDANLALNGIKQSFEKTALLFGLMNTAKELGERGGISNPSSIASQNPNPRMYVTNGVLNFAVSRCKSVGGSESVIRKRMPFLSYEGYNETIGTAQVNFLLADAAKYPENFADVKNNGYSFNALVHIFMLKKGTVTLKICQPSRCNNPPDVVQTTVSESGTTAISFGSNVVKSANEDVNIQISGSDPDVAVVREMAVSIYDRQVVSDPNRLLTKKVDDYRQKLAGEGVVIDPLEAAFLPAGTGYYNTLQEKEGFLRGLAWAPDKVDIGRPSADVSGWGVSEEDAKIRYWRIYKTAGWFVDHYEDWTEPRMWNRINSLSDHSEPSKRTWCNSGGRPSGYDSRCPSDTTTPYGGEDFRRALDTAAKSVGTDLSNRFNAVGFKWVLSVPSNAFAGCSTNTRPAATAILEWCNSQNMEYYKYKGGIFAQSATRPQACGSSGGCSAKESTCDKSAHGYDDSNTCYMRYKSRYLMKNVPINVTIIDEKYLVFDSVSKLWVPYQFTFFVEIDRIDDNSCGDGASTVLCSDRTVNTYKTMPEPPISVPAELL